MTDTKPIRRAVIGTGVIGASWTALFLAKGLQVVATDIAPNAEAALRKFVETAGPALKRLGFSPGASQSNLKFTAAFTPRSARAPSRSWRQSETKCSSGSSSSAPSLPRRVGQNDPLPWLHDRYVDGRLECRSS
jgi:hypothetical protein